MRFTYLQSGKIRSCYWSDRYNIPYVCRVHPPSSFRIVQLNRNTSLKRRGFSAAIGERGDEGVISESVSRHSRGYSNPTVPVACGITGSFHCYNSLESILGIISLSRLNDDAGMLHSALNCSSSFSRTAKASAKACHEKHQKIPVTLADSWFARGIFISSKA